MAFKAVQNMTWTFPETLEGMFIWNELILFKKKKKPCVMQVLQAEAWVLDGG